MRPSCWPGRRTLIVITSLWSCLACSPPADADTTFDITLWPGGRIPFRFADAADLDPWGLPARSIDVPESDVRDQMRIWTAALSVTDPANPAVTTEYIQFVECPDRCEHEANYVLIRRNSAAMNDGRRREDNNLCAWRDADRREFLGRSPVAGVVTHLHLAAGQDENTIRHELGHCLGLWHEFNRGDADGWLDETPAEAAAQFADTFNTRPRGLMPMLGNYDYDSIMHYATVRDSEGNVHTFTDTNPANPGLRGAFSRWQLDLGLPPAGPLADGVSLRDRSRVLQMYARERYPAWGFFESLSDRPPSPADPSVAADTDVLADPFLAPGVRALGTPAIAHVGEGHYDVFVRGSDQQIYWRAMREPLFLGGADEHWVALGCCFNSDAVAVSRAAGEVDVVAVGNHGRPMHARFANAVWGAWFDVREVASIGGLRRREGAAFLGVALASRNAATLDLVVVKSTGSLAVSTLANGAWGPWRSLGEGYSVTARPAAVALSGTRVLLAVPVNGNQLHEVRVTMSPFPAPLVFALGAPSARTAPNAAPGLAVVVSGRYRVFVVTEAGRVAHRYSWTGWRDIGGIPLSGTGIAAAAIGAYGVQVLINGEDAVDCARACLPIPRTSGAFIQPGGLWRRRLGQ